MKPVALYSALGWVVAGHAYVASAQATFSPGPSYSIGIPSGSSISSSSTGPLYFQLKAPTSYQWVALGTGSQMAGSTIFVMYADGAGNVTISGRKASGQSEPKMDSGIQDGLELLQGSGIVGGNLVANVRCTTCTLDSDASSSSSPWIAAWNIGSSLDSTSTSATIRQHSNQNTRQVSIDLSTASLASDSNPWSTSSSTDPKTTDSGSSPTTAANSNPTSATSGAENVYGPGNFGPGSRHGDGNDDDDNDNANASNSGSNAGISFSGPDFSAIEDYQMAHGIVMGVVVVLLFPFGAMFMRMGGSGLVHGILQVVSLCALIVGLGLGLKLADMTRSMLNNTHTIFGLVICVLFLIQPIFGIIHHIQYKRNLIRAGVSHVHIWYGRILMLLAIINGGLGLQLAANSHNGEIAYGVVAGIVGVAYVIMVVVKRKDKQPPWRKEQIPLGSPPGYGNGRAQPHYGNQTERVGFK
ncbi:integral membrane protein [Marssonina coronariae]|uniref:Integral membrane protein n=1 Tax=Diplocarpon coronariae TaxID=2795749 RepID=A0A218YUR5_9HELO|nr:integral membrane protein [Marssonina coronariae]